MSEPHNPMEAARRNARPPLPRRFYKEVGVSREGEAFAVLLDGKPVRTPARHLLAVPTSALAERLAEEWRAQGDVVDPATMPLTRIVNAALDRVAGEMAAVRADVVRYAGSDLICYRAEAPEGLAGAQEAAWGPLVAWAREALGARLTLAAGVVYVPQDADALAAVDAAVAPLDALGLAALHTATTLTGSAIVALAVQRSRLTAEEAWAAAHVDEDWQMAQWGADETALAARAARWREMQAAVLILRERA